MFEGHRAKKAAKAYEGDLARWKQERDGYAELLEVAQGYNGSPCEEIMLGAGEAVFYRVARLDAERPVAPAGAKR